MLDTQEYLADPVMLNLFQHLFQTLNPPQADMGDSANWVGSKHQTLNYFG